MSVEFIINPETGEIVEEVHFHTSYTPANMVRIIPRTYKEEARFRAISDNAVRIRKLREEIGKLDTVMGQQQLCDELSQLQAAREQRRKLTEEVQRKENFAQTVETIYRLRQRAQALEDVEILLPTSEGEERMTLNLDACTGNGLASLKTRLEQLNETFYSEEPAFVKKTMQELVKLEEALEALPHQAHKAKIRELLRRELSESVAQRLAEAGWAVSVVDEGDVMRPIHLTLKNAIGYRATVLFACDDQIHLETPGFPEDARSALQQLVLGTLRESGAEKAKGRCTQDLPPQNAQKKRAAGSVPEDAEGSMLVYEKELLFGD